MATRDMIFSDFKLKNASNLRTSTFSPGKPVVRRTTRFIFIFSLLLFLGYHSQAQSYLGKTKKEILEMAAKDFPEMPLSYISDSSETYIEIIHDYEKLYYFLEEDVCVKFMVLKPYSCKCLEKDIRTYRENCIPLGELRWASPDMTKIYEMALRQEYYSLTIVPNDKKLSEL